MESNHIWSIDGARSGVSGGRGRKSEAENAKNAGVLPEGEHAGAKF
jgi:hypothetical protein